MLWLGGELIGSRIYFLNLFFYMTGRIKRAVQLVIFALGLLPCSASHSSTQIAKDTLRLQLRWKHQFQFAGFYAAIEQGYYRDEGLVVQLKEASDNINFAQIVLDGQADFGVESTSLLISRNQGKPLVVLASIFQHSPEVFITLAKDNINNIEDFSGKTALFSIPELPATGGIIVKENLLDKVVLSESDNRLEGLISGAHQIIDGYSIDMPYLLTQMGYHPKLISPINYGVDFYGDCIFTTEHFIEQNPDKTDAFVRASVKGWKYAMRHKRELIDIIIAKYNKEHTPEDLMYEARKMEELIQPQFVEIGYMHKERWQHIGEVYVSLGLLDEDFSLDGFMYSDYVERRVVNQTRMILTFTILMVLALGFLLIVTIFNRRLKREVVNQTRAIRISNQQLRMEISDREAMHANLEMATRELEQNQRILKVNNATLSERNIIIEQINQELENAKRKAEESDRLKSAFISNMSHEIRTPMNGIIGFSELLKEQDISVDEKERYAKIIDENSTQLLRIISDIVDISKIEVGEISIKKETVHIKNLFENIYHNFSLKTKQLRKGQVNICFEIGEGVGESIQTDPARLMQVLGNLIENAIKFTTEGEIRFSVVKNADWYEFFVCDTGKGISKETVEMVFERFFKDNDQYYADMGGTGLGLSIAKNMVELLGGRIRLKSELGVGSQFSFTHPV